MARADLSVEILVERLKQLEFRTMQERVTMLTNVFGCTGYELAIMLELRDYQDHYCEDPLLVALLVDQLSKYEHTEWMDCVSFERAMFKYPCALVDAIFESRRDYYKNRQFFDHLKKWIARAELIIEGMICSREDKDEYICRLARNK